MNPMPRPLPRVEVHMLRSLIVCALGADQTEEKPHARARPHTHALPRGNEHAKLSCFLRQECLPAALLQWD